MRRACRRALPAGAALAALAVAGGPAQADPLAGTPAASRPAAAKKAGGTGSSSTGTGAASCSAPVLTQPFLSAGDAHWYTLMAGESADQFDGAGWQLSHGAKVVSAKLADGTRGTVLDLPAGAQAVSPTICVASDYPMARTMIRNVRGHGGIAFYMSLAGTRTWSSPQSSGQRHGKQAAWSLTNRINLHLPHKTGWHLLRIKLAGSGTQAEEQLYDFYIDPRMKW